MPRRSPEVEQVVREWLGDKQQASVAGIERRLSAYDGALAIGTDREEWLSGPAAFRDGQVSGGPFTATLQSVEAHREGRVAWAAVRASIETGEPGGFPVRLTLVLVEDAEGWRIVQSHASTPATE
jgi:ketosteroid isomerase-like protein